MEKRKKVVIVGGGFAGLAAAKALANKTEVAVTLLDQKNYHLFQPLLYQVATAGLNPADIAIPIRAILSKAENVAVRMLPITRANLTEGWVGGADTKVPYDYLLLACGAQHSYFGKGDWEIHAPGLKTVEQATEIRRRILCAFESAENETDPAKQEALLHFVIVGGGPTGVELAGAIADISRGVLVSDFRRIDPAHAKITLVEAGARLLAAFPEKLGQRAQRDLEKMGVEVRTNSRVAAIDAEGVAIGSERISARTVIWAAGVQAAPLTRELGLSLDRAGRVLVAQDLSVPTFPNVFAAGDLASLALPDGQPVPGLAPAAIQGGECVAHNILASIHVNPRRPFRYRDKGQMATIGKSRAVAMVGKFTFTGFLAWLAWMLIHLLYLIGFKNRVMVLGQWVWSYLFSKRGARLITNPDWMLHQK